MQPKSPKIFTWTPADLEAATKGRILSPGRSPVFRAIGIDSRRIGVEDLFVAIKGIHHDGHDFVSAVLEAGGQGIVVQEDRLDGRFAASIEDAGVFCLAVADTTKALGDLARFRRCTAQVKVAALTGSNGKTSTREMLSQIAAQKFAVLSTKGNFNNEIGMPLTLLALEPAHQWAVLELGMNHFGEIAYLGRICEPEVGVILNVAAAHLEGVQTLDGVARAKAELIPEIKPGGAVVLNADDPQVAPMAQKAGCRVILFGMGPGAQVRGRRVLESPGYSEFDLELAGEQTRIRLQAAGRFMVANALAAAAAAWAMGLGAAEIKAGLEAFRPVAGRMNVIQAPAGVSIVDDTYNANPGSMVAALETLQWLKGEGRAIFVAGDMFELGDQAAGLHRQIGAKAAQAGIAHLFAMGQYASDMALGAQGKGLAANHITTGEFDDILAELKQYLKPGDWVLIKGSRAMAMERFAAALTSGS